MSKGREIVTIIILLAIQLVLAKYCQGEYLYLSLLPAMILCTSTSFPTWIVCILAFGYGLLTDSLADGLPGLNALALVPCAALQKPLIKFFIDPELVERGYSFSLRRNGFGKISAALLVSTLLMFVLYVVFDSAGTRSFGFIVAKVLVSTVASMPLGLIVCNILCPYQRD